MDLARLELARGWIAFELPGNMVERSDVEWYRKSGY